MYLCGSSLKLRHYLQFRGLNLPDEMRLSAAFYLWWLSTYNRRDVSPCKTNSMKYGLLLLSVLVILSCSKPVKDNKIDPSTVQYQMRATVNGEAWTSANTDNSNLPVTWSKDTSRPVALWKIVAQNLNKGQTIQLYLVYNNITLNADYFLFYPVWPSDQGYYSSFSLFSFTYGGTVLANMGYPRAEARLRITRFDGEKMSGNFDFKMGRYISPGVWDSVVVTNGVFTDITR